MRRIILSTALVASSMFILRTRLYAQTPSPLPASTDSKRSAEAERPKDAVNTQQEQSTPAETEQRLAYRAESNGTAHAEEGTTGTALVDPKAYIIGPADFLRISVWREAELSGERSVRPDGMVSLPLINEIRAAGCTPEQLAAVIKEKLSKYILRPLVTVSVQQVNSKKYYIQGEVQKPGVFPLVEPTTVLEALGNAGGVKEFANTKNILILRGTERFKFNYKSVREGKNTEQNIILQSGDQIIVK